MSEKTYEEILREPLNSHRLHGLFTAVMIERPANLLIVIDQVRAWCAILFPALDPIEHIRQERARQEELKAAGKFPWTCADEGPLQIEKQAVLYEELGEVAKEVVEGIIKGETDNDALYKELIQVGAVCVAWLESLEK